VVRESSKRDQKIRPSNEAYQLQNLVFIYLGTHDLSFTIEVYCLLITIILMICHFITTNKKTKTHRSNVLFLMIFVNALVIISFIISVLNEGHPEVTIWNNIVTGICYACGTTLTELFGEYINIIVGEKQKINQKIQMIFRIVCSVLIFLNLISILNGMYFSTVNGFHIRGPYYMFNQGSILIIILLELGYILYNMNLIGRQALALLVCGLIPAASVFVQIFVKEYVLIYPAITLAMLISYIVSYIYMTNELHTKNTELIKAIEDAEQAKKMTEQANRSKTEFLSSMSHDIRTPLNAIVGMTEMAIENINNQALTLENLNVVRDSSKHLLYMVNDVFDLSMIESGKIQISKTEFFFADMLKEIESLVWPLTREKQQKFILDFGNEVEDCYIGDAPRIKQILMNFLSNAVKYTQRGGCITLKINEEKKDDEQYAVLKLACIDNGIGIDKKTQEHMFEPFKREVRSTINPIEGTGLGLAIAHRIVEAMHGTITVQSEKGMGSRFCVTLPIQRGNEEKMMEQFKDVRNYYALVIADTDEVCNMVHNDYRNVVGVDCDILKSEEVLQGKLKFKNFDVIICISVEKVMDVLHKLREIFPTTGILFGCSMDRMDQERQVLDAGIDAVLYRPFFKSTLFHEYQKLKRKKNSVEESAKYLLGKNILVAEDNSINYMIIEHMLQNAGAIVWRAETGLGAVDLYLGSRKGQFSAILMDIMMPVMDGYTATEKIRNSSRPDSKSIPIIAMTANAFAEDIQKSKDYNMNAHLSKPLDAKSVKETLLCCMNQEENN